MGGGHHGALQVWQDQTNRIDKSNKYNCQASSLTAGRVHQDETSTVHNAWQLQVITVGLNPIFVFKPRPETNQGFVAELCHSCSNDLSQFRVKDLEQFAFCIYFLNHEVTKYVTPIGVKLHWFFRIQLKAMDQA